MAGARAATTRSRQVSRWVRRHRRLLAALSAGVCVLALSSALQPARPATVSVLVAARDLVTGTRLAAEDIAVAAVAAALAPPGTLADPDAAVGQVLGAAMSRGEPLTTTRLVVPGGAWQSPEGTAPLPVRFSDADASGLLAAGMRIDVLSATSAGVDDLTGLGSASSARPVASDVLVLAVTGVDAQDDGLLDGRSTLDQGGPLVVVAATAEQVLAIAGAQAGGRLSFALVTQGSGA